MIDLVFCGLVIICGLAFAYHLGRASVHLEDLDAACRRLPKSTSPATEKTR